MAAQYGVGQSVRGSRVRTVATYVRRVCGVIERIGRMRLCVCVQQDSRTLFVVTIRLRNNISDLAPAPPVPVRGRGSPRRSLTGVRSHFFQGPLWIVWRLGDGPREPCRPRIGARTGSARKPEPRFRGPRHLARER
jgi:hypothetical protein